MKYVDMKILFDNNPIRMQWQIQQAFVELMFHGPPRIIADEVFTKLEHSSELSVVRCLP